MSVLVNTQIQLAKTMEMIRGEEQALVDHPEERDSILLSISSLEKMQRQLEADLLHGRCSNAALRKQLEAFRRDEARRLRYDHDYVEYPDDD